MGIANTEKRREAGAKVLDIKVWHAESFTATDLLLNPPQPPEWIVHDLLPVGLAYLAGRPKTGKSLLAGQIARSVTAADGTLFDLDVRHGPALYVDVENSRWRLYDRMRKAGYFSVGMASDRLHYITDWNPGNRTELLRKLDEIKPVFAVVDTWAKFRAPRFKDMDQYDFEGEELRWLHAEANARGMSILCVGHRTKLHDPTDPFINFAGSTAVTAGVDVMLAFSKVPSDTALRQLDIRGRDTGDSTWILKLDENLNCIKVCKGAEYVTADQGRYLEAMGSAVWSQKDLAKKLGVSQPAVSGMLATLCEKGLAKLTVGGTQATEEGLRIVDLIK